MGPVKDLGHYFVLHNFRLVVLLEGIYQRSLRDPDQEDQDDIGARALSNVDRALAILDGERS